MFITPLRSSPCLLRSYNYNYNYNVTCPYRYFSSTSPYHNISSEKETYYEILQVSQTASQAEIKRQFYTLSKLHHPDLHPSDPEAPSRFHHLSNAYQTLSSPSKRSIYDRSLPSSPRFSPRSGSYSSASASEKGTGTVGGRPASGLSRRRTQFRGPPASFYAGGGYGAYSKKRNESVRQGTGRRDEDVKSGMGDSQGYGDEGGYTYWNRKAHLRTHENIDARFDERRAKAMEERMRRAEMETRERYRDTVWRAVGVTGLLGVILLGAGVIGRFSGLETNKEGGGGMKTRRKKKDDDGG